MIKPAPKTSQIKEQLAHAIDTRNYLGEFEFAKVKREISKLPDLDDKAFMLAMAYGAANQQDEAVSHFESAIARFGDLMVMHDYCLYLRKIGRYVSAYTCALEYAERYDNPSLVEMAIDLAHIFYDFETIDRLFAKMRKYFPDHKVECIEELTNHLSETNKICESTGCDNDSLKKLVMLVHRYVEDSKIIISSTSLISGIEGLSYECTVEVDSVDAVARMNFEIASIMTEEIDLLLKGITCWFKINPEKVEASSLVHAC